MNSMDSDKYDDQSMQEDPMYHLRDTSHDPHREPGPINLQRYNGELAYAGIATFMGFLFA